MPLVLDERNAAVGHLFPGVHDVIRSRDIALLVVSDIADHVLKGLPASMTSLTAFGSALPAISIACLMICTDA